MTGWRRRLQVIFGDSLVAEMTDEMIEQMSSTGLSDDLVYGPQGVSSASARTAFTGSR